MKVVPTLNSKGGWIKGIDERIDGIMANYLSSNLAQSLLFGRAIRSLQATIESSGGDRGRLTSAIKSDLNFIFSNNFQDSRSTLVINVDIEPTTLDGRHGDNITISGELTVNDTIYDISKSIAVVDSRFISVANTINTM